jgi:hypothetical protein
LQVAAHIFRVRPYDLHSFLWWELKEFLWWELKEGIIKAMNSMISLRKNVTDV